MASKDTNKGIGVAELAAHLKTEPRSLRAWLRRNGGAVGKGSRYRWPSLADAAVKKLAADYKAAQASAAGPDKDDKG